MDQVPGTHFALACPVDMHVESLQEPVYAEFFGERSQTKNRALCCAGAFAIDMHMEMSQAPCHAEIYL